MCNLLNIWCRSEQTRAGCFESIPPEIFSHILLFTDVKTLGKCACVSKRWREAIRANESPLVSILVTARVAPLVGMELAPLSLAIRVKLEECAHWWTASKPTDEDWPNDAQVLSEYRSYESCVEAWESGIPPQNLLYPQYLCDLLQSREIESIVEIIGLMEHRQRETWGEVLFGYFLERRDFDACNEIARFSHGKGGASTSLLEEFPVEIKSVEKLRMLAAQWCYPMIYSMSYAIFYTWRRDVVGYRFLDPSVLPLLMLADFMCKTLPDHPVIGDAVSPFITTLLEFDSSEEGLEKMCRLLDDQEGGCLRIKGKVLCTALQQLFRSEIPIERMTEWLDRAVPLLEQLPASDPIRLSLLEVFREVYRGLSLKDREEDAALIKGRYSLELVPEREMELICCKMLKWLKSMERVGTSYFLYIPFLRKQFDIAEVESVLLLLDQMLPYESVLGSERFRWKFVEHIHSILSYLQEGLGRREVTQLKLALEEKYQIDPPIDLSLGYRD